MRSFEISDCVLWIYIYMHLISYIYIYSRCMLFGFIGLVLTKFDLLLTFLLGIMPKKWDDVQGEVLLETESKRTITPCWLVEVTLTTVFRHFWRQKYEQHWTYWTTHFFMNTIRTDLSALRREEMHDRAWWSDDSGAGSLQGLKSGSKVIRKWDTLTNP